MVTMMKMKVMTTIIEKEKLWQSRVVAVITS